MDYLIDYLFKVQEVHAYPLENGVSKFDKERKKTYNYHVWLDLNPMTCEIIVCKDFDK